jgi:hypothetical protein
VRNKSKDLWKLNISILEEEEYIKLVHVFIDEMSQHTSRIENIDHWWENTSNLASGVYRLIIVERESVIRESNGNYSNIN